MNGFECMLIKYPQRTQGQETVKTLQQKASWSRVGLGLKWQVQNISTLSKWKWLRIFTSREKWASKWKQSQVACTIRRSQKPETSSCEKSYVLDEWIEVAFYLDAVSFFHKYNET